MSTIPKHEVSAPRRERKQPQPAERPKPAEPRERTGTASDYGRYYWCVKTDLSESGEIYLFADEVRHLPNGGVLFVAQGNDHERTNLALAAAQWTAVFAAS